MFTFVLSSCSKQLRPTPLPSEQKLDASLEEILDLYRLRLKGEDGLRAMMQVKADLGDRGIHAFQATWHSQEDEIKIKGFDLIGRTLFELDFYPSTFTIKIPSEQKVFEGDLEFFDELAGQKTPFGSLDLLKWVKWRGIPKITSDDVPAIEKGEDYYILYLFSTDRGRGILQEKIWIERKAFRVKKVELFDRSGLRRGMIELDDYREIGGKVFPFSIKGRDRAGKIELKFKEVLFPKPESEEKDENFVH